MVRSMNNDAETFNGLAHPAWACVYTLITLGLLAVAVVTAIHVTRQWENARKGHKEAKHAFLVRQVLRITLLKSPFAQGGV